MLPPFTSTSLLDLAGSSSLPKSSKAFDITRPNLDTIMSPVEQVQPFALEKLRGSICFCGAPTTTEHEFCFCSTKCARADALRALDSSESHYRKVFQRACVGPAPDPRRKASVGLLHPNLPPPPQQGWASKLQSSKHVQPPNTLENSSYHRNFVYPTGPTLEQVTDAVLGKKTRAGEGVGKSNYDIRTYVDGPMGRGPCMKQVNEGKYNYVNAAAPPATSLYQIPMPEHGPPRTLRRAQPSTTGLKDNFQKSVGQLFYNPKVPESAFDRNFQPHPEPSNPGRIFGHPIDPQYSQSNARPRAPRPLPKTPSTTTIRRLPKVPPVGPQSRSIETQRSKTIRRSASYAGWITSPNNSVVGGDEAFKDAFAQVRAELRAVADEEFDPRDYFKRDEDDM